MPNPHRPHAVLAATLSVALLVAACSSDDDESSSAPDDGIDPGAGAPLAPADGTLRARIRRTEGGVPHIDADDLASAAFGAGFVQAEDNVCLIAEAVLKARGERALFFGPDDENVVSDFSYRALATADDTATAIASLSAPSRALLDGFVAGYNRYVADTPPGALPAACAGQPWVREIGVEDLYAYYRLVAQYASGDLFADGALFAAVPPGTSPAPRVVDAANRVGRSDGANGRRMADAADAVAPARIGRSIVRRAGTRRAFVDTALGSNAWGIGRALSENGRGALLANPHFPYTGVRRFYQFHLRVPGYYDVNGAGLIGTAVPLIGFNRNVAWSHTVSTGRRFTLYELALAEDDPLVYVKDGERRPIESRTIRVAVADGDGEPTVLEREVYFSEHGPLLAADLVTGGALPSWGEEGRAYAFRDANAGASGFLDTWLGLGRATDLDAFRRVFEEDCGSTFWTNTVYADDAGRAFYVDSSSVPNLSPEAIEALEGRRLASPLAAELFDAGLTLLDGSTSRDDWVEGDCGGIVPYADKPALVREDFVQNSNSSHWATNPAEPLVGFSPLFGREGEAVNPRTQLGLRMLQAPTDPGFAASAPAGQDGRFGARDLIETIWNDRALHAELLLPELRERCTLIGETPVTRADDGGAREVATGCAALAAWDGTYGVASTGAHLFRVALARLFAREDLALPIDFDPADPAATTFVFDDAETRGTADDVGLQALASALDVLASVDIAPDATLGSVQTWRPSGGAPPGGEPVALADPIPWHGGSGSLDGAFNAVGVVTSPVIEDSRFPRLAPTVLPATDGLSAVPGEGWRIARGTSWHFGLAFTDDGPEAYGLVSYSQSSDPASPHFVDQSLAYSAKEARPLRYDEADIAANVLADGERLLEGTLPD